jgi:hypothetical protein
VHMMISCISASWEMRKDVEEELCRKHLSRHDLLTVPLLIDNSRYHTDR